MRWLNPGASSLNYHAIERLTANPAVSEAAPSLRDGGREIDSFRNSNDNFRRPHNTRFHLSRTDRLNNNSTSRFQAIYERAWWCLPHSKCLYYMIFMSFTTAFWRQTHLSCYAMAIPLTLLCRKLSFSRTVDLLVTSQVFMISTPDTTQLL